MAGVKSSIYLSDELREKLRTPPYGSRGTSSAVSITIDRFSVIKKSEETILKKIFSDKELKTLAELVSGTEFVPASVCRNGVLSIVQDSDIDAKKELVKKLSELSTTQQIILVEMLEETIDN